MVLLKIGIGLCLIFVTLDSVSSLWTPSNPGPREICRTPECQKRGNEYLENINPSVHPCDDFFKFACGNWMNKEKNAPKYQPEWSVAMVMRRNMFKILKDLLDKTKFGIQDKILTRVQTVYKICTARRNTTYYDLFSYLNLLRVTESLAEFPRKDAEGIAAAIQKIGRYPKTDIWKLHNNYLKTTGESSLFNFMYLVNEPPQEPLFLMFMEPISAYGAIFHDRHWKDAEKQNYLEFLFQIMKSLKLSRASDTILKEKLKNVFNFRERLNKVVTRNERANPNKGSTMTLSELEAWFKQSIPNPTKTQNMPWRDIVKTILHTLPESKVTENVRYSIRQKRYFLEMMDLLKTTSEQVLADHMEVHFVETHLRLSKEMYNLLERTAIEPHQLVFYIRERYKSRWEICIQRLNTGETLERLLHDRWFAGTTKTKVEEMIKKIKSAIKDQMMDANWLDLNEYKKIKEKLDGITNWIGFPPSYDTPGATPELGADFTLFPNAYLNMGKDWIYIHSALMQPPLFDAALPAVYNYGGIGSFIGHELYHVMNECGKYSNGTHDIVWWQKPTQLQCMKNKDCYMEEYQEIIDREYKKLYGLDESPNSEQTVEEDFPDHMGLEAAYKAFQNINRTNPDECKVLPQFPNYNCDHMFFLAYANSMCGFYTTANAKDQLSIAEHSSYSVRVNGPLSMSSDFSTAFECDSRRTMNSPRKCNLWN